MKKILIPILAMSLFVIIGCEKEETTEGAGENCILTKISFSILDGSAGYDIDFTYDTQERLVGLVKTEYDIGDPYINSYVIEYGGDGVSKITSSNSLTGGGEIYDFNYVDGKIDSVHVWSYPNTELWNHRYIMVKYTGDKMSRLDHFYYNNFQGTFTVQQQQDIQWDGDNVSKAGDWQYTYDDKPSALRNIGMAFTGFESIAMISKNNVLTSQHSGGNLRARSYTYNDQGYPITMDDGVNDQLVYYEYSCK